MAYYHFRNARAVDADTVAVYTRGLTKLIQAKHESATLTSVKGGGETSGDDLRIQANTVNALPTIDLSGNSGIGFDVVSAGLYRFYTNGTEQYQLGSSCLFLKETTTPTAKPDFGAIYTKNDNKLYFQDGAGVEHTVAFV